MREGDAKISTNGNLAEIRLHPRFKPIRTAALAEWRQLLSA